MKIDIRLPHLGYTVRIRGPKPHPDGKPSAAWITRDNADRCTIYLPNKLTPGMVSHELVHALQYICEDRNMEFLTESEHTAYLMQYMMNRCFGYTFG